LTAYCGELERSHGVVMRCCAEGDFATMGPEAGLCVYRIAQEALRNVVAHAGATRANVRLVRSADAAEITITDDGCGFDVNDPQRRTGLGLVSITERAKIVGGTVSIEAGVNQGTRVHATIPLTGRLKTADAGAREQVA
jgi:signal transduction histidine kinase